MGNQRSLHFWLYDLELHTCEGKRGCIYVPSFLALWSRVFEITHLGGVAILSHLIFLQIFILVSKSLCFCFSATMFQIDVFRLLMTGVNTFWSKLSEKIEAGPYGAIQKCSKRKFDSADKKWKGKTIR